MTGMLGFNEKVDLKVLDIGGYSIFRFSSLTLKIRIYLESKCPQFLINSDTGTVQCKIGSRKLNASPLMRSSGVK